MSNLDSSSDLEFRLIEIKCDSELKSEILSYIEENKHKRRDEIISFDNYCYRNNLHYIEDNIGKKDLINEIRKGNSKK